MTVVGTLHEIHRFPLKSAAGERLDDVRIGPSGLDGDRRWALTTEAGEPVTARTAPHLRRVVAATDGDDLVITTGDGPPLRHHDAQAALAGVVGQPVRWEEASSHVDVAAVHLVSAGASSAADAPSGCDPEPRANLVLELDAGPGGERGWTGRSVRIGDVELRVTRTPKSCLGVYAEVAAPGRVSVGDTVHVD